MIVSGTQRPDRCQAASVIPAAACGSPPQTPTLWGVPAAPRAEEKARVCVCVRVRVHMHTRVSEGAV